MNDCLLKKEQYTCLYYSSYLSLISTIYSIYRNYYFLTPVPLLVFLSSINYWRNPVSTSWRRYLDICTVFSSLCYQLYYVHNAQYVVLYYIFTSISILAYLIGVYYYRIGKIWYSVYSHMSLHLIANIANIIVYTGNID